MRFRRSDVFAFLVGVLLVGVSTPLVAQTVPTFTPAQIAAQCQASFSLSARTGEPDVVGTVNGYHVQFTVDAAQTQPSPVTFTCSGAASSPYTCTGTYTVPSAGQTLGTHTLAITVTDPADGSSSTALVASYKVATPLGPVPPPTNWKFIIGGVVAGVVAVLVAVFAHHA